MKKLIFVAICLLISGCATSKWQEQSSGLIGCPPKDIKIEKLSSSSFKATCRNHIFYCSEHPSGEGTKIKCKEEIK